MQSSPKAFILALVIVLLLLVGGAILVWRGIPVAAEKLASFVPVTWEEQFGEVVARSMAPAGQRCGDRAGAGLVQGIVEKLAASGPKSPYKFRVTVVDNPEINALAAPGGYIVVFRGLLEKTQTAEELAGVLAHEMQHVIQRHTTKALFRELSTSALLALILGDAQGAAVAVEAARQLGVLHYQRRDEETADREGLKLLEAARVDTRGMIDFFRVLERESPDMPAFAHYLSTHPRAADRISKLEKQAAAARYTPVALVGEGDYRSGIRAVCEAR